ncbi:hypothetical protein [Ectobacillus ponti]|uniref:Uncharacterized protein n=1 Tax=Ectobacillus ponti TaxID=2961894 RepID=A0AA42BNU0_9BACI|nr:hypothetical protein [Ectobacillus ponti]MCP8967706.1 hypothetical protein [Ectobacillus ponti]
MKRYERKLKQISLKRQAHQLRVQSHEEDGKKKEQPVLKKDTASAS